MRLTSLHRIALLALLFSPIAAAAQDRSKALTAPEAIKLMEESKISYSVVTMGSSEEDIEKSTTTLFSPLVERILLPTVTVNSQGRRVVQQFTFDDEAMARLREAEPLFQAEKYDEARAIYNEIVAKHPSCYLAYSHIGDCLLFTDQASRALEYYDTAISINKLDYQLHFYRGHALVKAGRWQEAADAFVEALLLNPHHENSLAYLRRYADKMNITVNDPLFLPMAYATKGKEENQVMVIVPKEEHAMSSWLMYAIGKALWIGEPKHREEMLGTDGPHIWSPTEEQECLQLLAQGYLVALSKEDAVRDASLDRLVSIIKEGELSAFIAWEIGSRIDPNIMLRQEAPLFAMTREFIRKYVVVKKG